MRQNTVTYFIQSGADGAIKIGKTTQMSLRMSQIQNGSAEVLSLIGWIHGDMEQDLHQHFAHLRIRGEWFRPEEQILEFIRERCNADTRECVVSIARSVSRLYKQAIADLMPLFSEMATNDNGCPKSIKHLFDKLALLRLSVSRVDRERELIGTTSLRHTDEWLATGCKPVQAGAAQ